MNANKISMALSALALLSTTSAFAQGIQAQVGPIGASVGAATVPVEAQYFGAGNFTTAGPTVLQSPAIIGSGTACGTSCGAAAPIAYAPACGARPGLFQRLFTPRNGRWFNLGAFGYGVKFGGPGPDFYNPALLGPNAMIYPTRSLAAANGLGVLSQAAVVSNNCGGYARGLGGDRLVNPWLDLHLLRFGFSAGGVNPAFDMRNPGAW